MNIYLKTFEIMGKWFAQQHKVTIAYDTEGGAHADLKNDILHLPNPTKIADEHALGSLALLFHEAAHLRYSKGIPIKKVAPMQSDFHILNAIEDIRIDRLNFQIMPNVFNFYEELVKKEMDLTREFEFSVPDAARRLCAGILLLEGFKPTMRKVDKEFIDKTPLLQTMERGIQEIHDQSWNKLTGTIQEIKKILKIDPKQDKPNKSDTMTGDPNGEDQEGQQGQGQSIQGTASGGKDSSQGQGGEDPNDLSGVGRIVRPGAVWGSGKRMEGGSSLATSPLAMDEQCANQFKEILNIKEIKILEDGAILDSDNLISLYTGDVQTLFKQERTVRNKKSKIMFLMDCSGSMSEPMLDTKPRYTVVKSSVQKLVAILREVQELEGLNVDWAISQFDDSYEPLDKDNWEHKYYPSGGTNFIDGFDGAMQEMLKDYTIEGKRIIVAFSDGDISEDQINHVEGLIKKHYADVRMLIIGVGSNLAGPFVKNIVGSNVIVAQENSVEIIMEVISQML